MILTRQGEIWLVNFYPSVGSEIQKLRPAVIVDDDSLATKMQNIRFIIPITSWRDKFDKHKAFIKIDSNQANGLSNTSAFSIKQAKYASLTRFHKKIGFVEQDLIIKLHERFIYFLNPYLKIVDSRFN
ncbi:type II toxin-antitoxin system PemK/MazF family toxin [Campylobacter upsaliensis]|uniref:type II toxin-antitoxin system PemK/MazF family toxin n=1 Tax=Campylobacter upsaliensis TaxID=28080 RepID=UPI002149D827|nr:type II toxin-antitoxin system PemK/MazF family toxin [Campylobacter upsaliensis]MCR2091827.1 type II toxin-antitoxin system PemK/MazF family toxin [Campylobacter upsaliensis]